MAVSFGKGLRQRLRQFGFPSWSACLVYAEKKSSPHCKVFLNLRLRLSVPVERGEDFLGEGKTIDVSQDGASITVDRDLGVGQTIKTRRVGANKGNRSLGNEVVAVPAWRGKG